MAIIKRSQRSDKILPTRYYSSKQEKNVAKHFQGKQTKNSGATDFEKSDVLLDKMNLECKTKVKHSDSISIKKDWIQKLKEESLLVGKPYSAVVISFGPDEENYYVIDQELMDILVSKIDQLK